MKRIVLSALAMLVAGVCLASLENEVLSQDPPENFQSIFNGTDLSGWYAIDTYDPREFAKLTDDEQKAKVEAARKKTGEHWRVENGEIVNDGKGPFLTTDGNYSDFELLLEYKTVPNADSGIYLKATPQVQIWDFTDKKKFKIGADKGSGGLWNNSAGANGKDPVEVADNPLGQWNHFRIRQLGARTDVWLNEKHIVKNAVMENYWDKARTIPLFAKGPIQLQTHGGEIRWRSIYLREIQSEEANKILAENREDGFESIFNGNDFTGWKGPIENYEINDGVIQCKPHKGGTVYTEKEYSDFVATMEFRLPPGGNNGLAIRYPGQGDTAYGGMCELQVLDDTHQKYANLDDRQFHGSAYGMAAAHRGYLRPVGQWNYQEVTVKGSTIKVELNGTIILNSDLSKVTDYMADKPHPGKDRTSGHFGLAGHSDPVEYRNLRIKSLK